MSVEFDFDLAVKYGIIEISNFEDGVFLTWEVVVPDGIPFDDQEDQVQSAGVASILSYLVKIGYPPSVMVRPTEIKRIVRNNGKAYGSVKVRILK